MASTNRKLEFKLMIDKDSQKVLFAEVRKDVVDFLLSLFALPMGSVTNLITKESTTGSLGTLYSSWNQLSDHILSSTEMKPNILCPTVSASATPGAESSSLADLLASFTLATEKEVYKCRQDFPSILTDFPIYGGPGLTDFFTEPSNAGSSSAKEVVGGNGYVKGGFTYAVLDNLSVAPLETALAIFPFLNNLGHKDLSLLEEKTVTLDVKTEGLEFLNTSLWSKNVLTDVFLEKRRDHEKEVE